MDPSQSKKASFRKQQQWTHSWLSSTFTNYGNVKEVYIPNKRTNKGSRFAFVRHNCSVSADVAILKANGMKVGNYNLLVKLAYPKQNKRRFTQFQSQRKSHKPTKTEAKPLQSHSKNSFNPHFDRDKHQDGECSKAPKLIKIQPSGNGWLFRSAVATLRRKIEMVDLKMELNKEDLNQSRL